MLCVTFMMLKVPDDWTVRSGVLTVPETRFSLPLLTFMFLFAVKFMLLVRFK